MKVFNKGVVKDRVTNKEYRLEGVDYDHGFKGGNGLVLIVSEDGKYNTIQEVITDGSHSIPKLLVSTIAVLEEYEFINS